MDMVKSVNMSLLLDFYGDMLTQKQKQTAELYYNEDLSLSEIAEITGLTRPGVRDRLKKSEAILRNLETNLHLLERFEAMKTEIAEITAELERAKSGEKINLTKIIEALKELS